MVRFGCGREVWSTICRRHTWRRLRWWLIAARASHCWLTNLEKLQCMHFTMDDTWWDDSSELLLLQGYVCFHVYIASVCKKNWFAALYSLNLIWKRWEFVEVANFRCCKWITQRQQEKVPLIFDRNLPVIDTIIYDWKHILLMFWRHVMFWDTGDRVPTCWWHPGFYWDFCNFGQTCTCRSPGGYLFHLETFELVFWVLIWFFLMQLQVIMKQ